MFSEERRLLLQKCLSTGKNDYIVSNVPPFIKDELNTELFRTNSFTNDESKSALLKHASLS